MTATAQLRTALAGRYVLAREIGAGGMATVYLADDVRHDRQVAIKVLHPELSAVLGPERFLAEIRTTAKLQHPHILPLFDSGEASGLLYYVMPYVEGETLRARLERERQLPVADALRIATEAADALQYAHEHGVVHRDIKPENILLQNGHALVADFGIALAVEQAGGQRMTQTGLSLGTPQYMAPEQAMGERNIDARADIYALGAVTYEMLAGEPPFTGPNAQAIVAKVITEDAPSVRAHRRSVPEHVDAAISRALEKLPADRFPTARELAEGLSGRGDPALHTTRAARARGRAVPGSEQRTRSLLWPALGALAALGMGAVAGAAWHARRTPTLRPARLAVTIPDEQRLVDIVGPPVVFSPDGRALVYVGATASAHTALFYRPLDRLEATELQGTDDAGVPFFSPDGRDVAFASYHVIKRVSVGGGPATPLLDAGAANFTIAGGAWGPGGVIVIGSEQGLWRIPESGGTAKLITHVDARSGELFHAMPRFLDGETVAFDVDYATGDGDSRVGLVSLRSGKVTILDVHARNTVGLVDGSLIVGMRGTGAGQLAALPFDARQWRVTGPAVPVLDEVAFKPNGGAEASLADDGSLVYVAGSAQSRLVVLDARGAEVGGPAESRAYSGPQFAPDGRHVALAIYSNAGSGASSDIWSYEIASGVLSRLSSRITALYPAWTPDGRSIVFEGAPGHDFSELWQVAADGSSPEQRVYTLPDGASFQWRPTFTPDGATMVEEVRTRRGRRHELWVLRRAPDGRWTGTPWLRQDANVENPQLSPDGHWIAYESDETGRFEAYVRPFPEPGGRVQVSTSGGRYPEWSRDGHRLYFLPSEMGGHLMQADLRLDHSPAVLGRSEAFTAGGSGIEIQTGGSYYNGDFDIRPDDKGAVVLRTPHGRQVVVVLGWREELRQKLAAAGTP